MATKSSKSIGDSIDKILLALGAILLIAAIAFTGMGLSKTLEPIETATMAARKDASALEIQPYQQKMSRLGHQYESRDGVENNVFTSELRVPSVNSKELYVLIPATAKKCPFTGEPQPDVYKRDIDNDGVFDGYEREHGMNIGLNDAWQDSDGDGFYNIEEFKSDTLASDDQSHPPHVTKLKLVKAVNKPQRFEIVGVTKFSDTNIVFSLKMGGSKTHFVKIGATVEGWTLKKWNPKKADAVGAPDLSTLLISNGEDEVTLTRNKPGVLNKWQAGLVYLADASIKYKVSEGDEFELRAEKYVVSKIARSEVKVISASDQEAHFLQKISKNEIAVLKGELKPGENSGFVSSEQ